MNSLISLHNRAAAALDRSADWVTPTLARVLFAAVLFSYYWSSAMTKLGDGALGFIRPSSGAYIQIFPKAVEAVSYDTSQLNAFHWLVVVAGTWAEFILPVLIVLGLFTRLSSLGMIGFIAVQTLVDIAGHNLAAADIGAWFDRGASSLIADQRAMWIFPLLVLVFRGGGPLSLDRVFTRSA